VVVVGRDVVVELGTVVDVEGTVVVVVDVVVVVVVGVGREDAGTNDTGR
jgi:hypothetical protein